MDHIQTDSLPIQSNNFYYNFSQPLKDERPGTLINARMALSQLILPINPVINKVYNSPDDEECTIEFIGIYSGIILPFDFFDTSNFNMQTETSTYDISRDKDKRTFEQKMKDYIIENIEKPLHSLFNTLLLQKTFGINFSQYLEVNDFKFNSALFWMLYYLRTYIGVTISDYDLMRGFLYQGNEMDVMYDAVKQLQSFIPQDIIEINGERFMLLPTEPKKYFTRASLYKSNMNMNVISETAGLKIAWSMKPICNVDAFINKVFNSGMYQNEIRVFAVHQYFRFVHVHFHVFPTLRHCMLYMWHNIDRSWQRFNILQSPSASYKNGRNNYNFACSKNDVDLLRLQVLCATPPPNEHNKDLGLDVNQMISYYGDMVCDRNFRQLFNRIKKRYNNSCGRFYIYTDLYRAYNTLFHTNYVLLTSITTLITYPMQIIDTAMPLMTVIAKSVRWTQFPDDLKFKINPKNISWITIDDGIKPRTRSTVLNEQQLFGVVAIRLFHWKSSTEAEQCPKPVDLLLPPAVLKNRFSTYKEIRYHTMRSTAGTLAGKGSNYGPKEYLSLMQRYSSSELIMAWERMLYANLFVKDEIRKYGRDRVLRIDENVKYNNRVNKSSIKQLSIFVFILKKYMGLSIRDILNPESEEISEEKLRLIMKKKKMTVMLVGVIDDPDKEAIEKTFPRIKVVGYGLDAFGDYNRTDIFHTIERSVANIVICDVDQALESTYEQVYDKLQNIIKWCDFRSSYAYAVKIQYCMIDTIGRIIDQLELDGGEAYITKAFHSPQYSAEWFLVVIKYGVQVAPGAVPCINIKELQAVELIWDDIDYKLQRFPIKEILSQYKNQEILNFDLFDQSTCTMLSASCKLPSFKYLLFWMSNFCDRVETGRLQTSRDTYLLYGSVSPRMLALFKRVGVTYTLKLDYKTLRVNNVGIMRRIKNTQFFGTRVTSTGAYNLATKMQCRMLIDNFRLQYRGGGPLRILSVGDGIYEGIVTSRPEDEYIILDKGYIPGPETRRVQHIYQEFDWAVHKEWFEKADVIMMMFSAFSIWKTDEFTKWLTDDMVPFILKVNKSDVELKDRKLFMFNYYTHEGAEMYIQNIRLPNGYIPDDLHVEETVTQEDEKIGITWRYTFGNYNVVDPVDETIIDDIKDPDTNKALFKRDLVTYVDVHDACVLYNKSNNMFLSQVLYLYNTMCPTWITGTPIRKDFNYRPIRPDTCPIDTCE